VSWAVGCDPFFPAVYPGAAIEQSINDMAALGRRVRGSAPTRCCLRLPDAVLEYARVIGDAGTADTIAIQAIGPDGNTVVVGLLLNASTSLIVEATYYELPAPDNDDVVAEIRDRIAAITRPLAAQPEDGWMDSEDAEII
jgi:hypothetical protein